MDFDEYKREAGKLYHKYLRLFQNDEGLISLPSAAYRFPGAWRPQYESFELIVDLIDTVENITHEIDEFKKQILDKRVERINALESSFTRKAVILDPPTRADGHRKDYKLIVHQAEQALEVYLHPGTRRDTAKYVFGFDEADPDQDPKNAERQVRQYHAHAIFLMNAAANGTFFEALEKPLPKK